MTSQDAEEALAELGSWNLDRPARGDPLNGGRLQRRYKISWWDALIVQSALALDIARLFGAKTWRVDRVTDR